MLYIKYRFTHKELRSILYCFFTDAIPISLEKYNDLQVLKVFCGQEARDFYSDLPKTEQVEKTQRKKVATRVEKPEEASNQVEKFKRRKAVKVTKQQ